MKSVWTDSIDIQNFDGLKKDIKTDVLIIGGGMAGLLCAYQLDMAGVNYVLVEGSRIGSGVTKNTTAKITSQHGLIYDNLIKNAGLEKAKMYLQVNELAISKFKNLCKDIDCNFEEKNAFVYSLTDRKAIENEVAAVNKLGMKAEFTDKLPLPFDSVSAIKFNNQAQFNPLKFIAAISKNLNIYENSFITSIDIKKGVAQCNNIKITADKIIVATHFPFINTHGSY
ncbi:MAG: FAD-binding oxidoreductase, partial [Bacillota bacterium]|nr:FAD-binding oxidoreductase [Bacillota bacterium]